MLEVRAHGRGGQGAVTLVTLLAKAAGYDGKYSQAFPAFGPERRGAPVKAFCRISDNPITLRSQVYNPDYVIVLDSTLLDLPQITEGLKEDSVVIVNSGKKVKAGKKTISFDATTLALKILGKDIVNTAMLGVFSKVTKLVKLESVQKAIEEVFGGKGKVADLNKELIKEAFENTKV